MTNQHPIIPPPELVREWNQDAIGTHFEPYGYSEFIATRAAQWGADTELEAVIEWMTRMGYWGDDGKAIPALRTARRPKPPSLKEQALDALAHIATGPNPTAFLDCQDTIRRALEQLDD
jgi:hypothetical protein